MVSCKRRLFFLAALLALAALVSLPVSQAKDASICLQTGVELYECNGKYLSGSFFFPQQFI